MPRKSAGKSWKYCLIDQHGTSVQKPVCGFIKLSAADLQQMAIELNTIAKSFKT